MTRYVAVFLFGVLVIMACLLAVTRHWTATVLVIIAVGAGSLVGRILTRRKSTGSRDRIEDEVINSPPIRPAILSRPGNRAGDVISGARDDGHA